MALLTPPGDNNPWACVCDFGIENCWDYKRDWESGENLEKLSMARTLWDKTPKEMVRCPHGRRRVVHRDENVQPVGSGSAWVATARERCMWAIKVLTIEALLVAIVLALFDARVRHEIANFLFDVLRAAVTKLDSLQEGRAASFVKVLVLA